MKMMKSVNKGNFLHQKMFKDEFYGFIFAEKKGDFEKSIKIQPFFPHEDVEKNHHFSTFFRNCRIKNKQNQHDRK